MIQDTQDLITRAIERLGRTTGMKATYQNEHLNESKYPDGLVRIEHQDMQWIFAVDAKTRVTRITAALVKAQQANLPEDLILITPYVTPPMAELMKEIGLFFMDAAGNAFINNPPPLPFYQRQQASPKADGRHDTTFIKSRRIKGRIRTVE